MLPVLALNNMRNGYSTYTVASADIGKISGTCNLSDVYDLLRCEFRHVILFSGKMASLLGCISMIIGIAAKKKMVWIDARRIVALMAKPHSCWNFSSMQEPRCAASANILTLAGICADLAIAVLIAATRPFPTPIFVFIGISIKAFLERQFWVTAVMAAIFLRRPRTPIERKEYAIAI